MVRAIFLLFCFCLGRVGVVGGVVVVLFGGVWWVWKCDDLTYTVCVSYSVILAASLDMLSAGRGCVASVSTLQLHGEKYPGVVVVVILGRVAPRIIILPKGR